MGRAIDNAINSIKSKGNYNQRLYIYKKAYSYMRLENLDAAMANYEQFLNMESDAKGVKMMEISPSIYDKDAQPLDLFLVAQAFWAMSKICDRKTQDYNLLSRYLDKFIQFSMAMKYQYVSWQLVKRFNKRNIAKFPKPFKDAEKKLRQSMDGCFIASYLFGEDSEYTNTFRKFKPILQRYYFGNQFIDWYYTYSPALVRYFKSRGTIINFLLRKVFVFLANILKRFL